MTAERGDWAAAPLTTQLLVDLVTNPLDLGYAAAARRRGTAPGRRWYDRPAVALGCALIGFTLVISYVHTNRGAPAAAKLHASLVSRARNAQHQVSALGLQAQQLTSTLSALRDQALVGGSLKEQLDREQMQAGQVPVVGPGLEVALSEPKSASTSAQAGRAGATPIGATNILTDRDVRSVVNELWADGAEAISVNNVRLTPTSAIRFAGQAVLVDFQPITSPYTIRAVGSANDLATGFAASAVASRYQTLVSADGIGFSFTERPRISLPASAAVTARYAHPAPSGTTR